jgi:hypothetical protein
MTPARIFIVEGEHLIAAALTRRTTRSGRAALCRRAAP